MIDIKQILDVMPHRYPILLVDRVLEMDERRIRAIKNVTFNEPFFQGHFPGHPVMPGVLILEAMAQCGGFLLLSSVGDPKTKLEHFIRVAHVILHEFGFWQSNGLDRVRCQESVLHIEERCE